MGWTAPRTWVDEEVVTAAEFNEQIRDNSNYLADRLVLMYDVDTANPVRVVDGTEYTNSTAIRFIHVGVKATASAASGSVTLTVKVKSTSPADTIITKAYEFQYVNGQDVYCFVNFIVPPSYYYSVTEAHTNTGAVSIKYWTEQDFY